MSLPNHNSPTTPAPPSLAEAVAQARWPANRATVKLTMHREELLRLRQAGESVGSLVGGLRLLGVEIGHETLRGWLNRELGHQAPRRKTARAKLKSKPKPLTVEDHDALAGNTPVAVSAADLPASTRTPTSTALIRPGETALEALHRRLAEINAGPSTANGVTSDVHSKTDSMKSS